LSTGDASGARRLRPAAVLLGVLVLAGAAGQSCRGAAPAPAAGVPCAPVAGPLAAGARADGLAGEFRLTLVAERGAQAGASVSGALTLRAYGGRPAPVPASAGVRYPLFGGTDVRLDAVGAVSAGETGRADAARPGVLVMEWPRPDAPAGTHNLTLRLGADANQGGQQRFDGAYMALTVTSIAADRFAGTWESGAGQPRAGGHFCAERTGAAR
jgi:hypothetical protein